jgi:hypothetical protein
MLDPSYALNRIGIASRGRCSSTFALSVKKQTNCSPATRETLDEH